MWFGKIEELLNCKIISEEHIEMILNFMRANNMVELSCGRYNLCRDCFVNVFEYDTKESDGVFEAHEKFTDVHFVITGKELVLWADKYSMETKPYQADGDYSLGTADNASKTELDDNLCVVFLPGDPHKAGICDKFAMKVKKAVFKLT